MRRTFCSWERFGWRSLLVQRCEHVFPDEEMAVGRVGCPYDPATLFTAFVQPHWPADEVTAVETDGS
ncbi:hypothetical protein KIPE111705_30830 [Kibdelosporangium persicum]